MKAKHDTLVLLLFLYPFVALPLGFLMLTMGWANNQTFIISLGLAISGLAILSYNVIREKFIEKPKYRSNKNEECSFYSKNRYKKLVLRYT
ncbi:MAG: hypothetical protein ACE5RJ_01290 [Nitrosopumilaceae archaeon]